MSGKNYPKGSEWRKWDLHVHTPASIVQNYGGPSDENWEKFISDLERLPSEFKVLGINDYLFLDGYKKVIEFKSAGRLSNIDLILPVLEFRMDSFAGAEEKLKRINLHVIFSDDLNPEQIQSQFLSAITSKVMLDPASGQTTWQGVITPDSLADLGRAIRMSLPEGKQVSTTDMKLGFNNLCINIDAVKKLLDENSYLRNNYLIAIGKGEWAEIKWTEAAIAAKKSIINGADFVFTSASNAESAVKSQKTLVEHSVNPKLLDCSDSHSFSNSTEKDRIGKCFTWIKGDPTFQALKHAVIEYDQRVFIGIEPEKRSKVRTESTKFLKSLEVRKIKGSTITETWFDFSVPLNPDLVAVIGNKGNGKTAFVEILGLSGNSKTDANFLFLNSTKFRHPKNNKSNHFDSIVTFEDNQQYKKNLSEFSNPNDIEKIKLLPQSLLETICNDIGKAEETEFDKELKDIIFSHVPDSDRLGMPDMNALIALKTTQQKDEILLHQKDLVSLNNDLLQLEEKRIDSYHQLLTNSLEQRKKDLQAVDSGKPKEVPKPDVDPSISEKLAITLAEIDALEKDKQLVTAKIDEAKRNQNDIAVVTQKIAILNGKISTVRTQLQKMSQEIIVLARDLKLENPIFQFEIETNELDALNTITNKNRLEIEQLLNPNVENNLYSTLKQLNDDITSKRTECDEPTKKFQAYQEELKVWEAKRTEIIGTKNQADTIEHLTHLLDEIKNIPSLIIDQRKKRDAVTSKIYACINNLSKIYKLLYKPVQDFVGAHKIVAGRLNLEFDVSVASSGFKGKFLDSLDKSVGGNFYGKEDSEKTLDAILDSADFSTEPGLKSFLLEIQNKLDLDKKGEPISINRQFRKGVSALEIYNYIYGLEFLNPKYTMKLGGKEVSQLSPGEKGTLLLVFYLLVDRRDKPLVIDQPEDNLDNQTIYDILVPSIKEAKKHRQIIMVTHNPNLAVVCDAEQIVHASIDKANGYIVKYDSGSIENPKIKSYIVDVLEGTMPAFSNRSNKYTE